MSLALSPLPGIPAVRPGDDLAAFLGDAIERSGLDLLTGDVVVVCQKVVSKSEGRIVDLASVQPSEFASAWAAEHAKDARVVELVLRETKRIVRMERGNLIVETGPGWICANAGIDQSNTDAEGSVTLLPLDADASATRIRVALARRFGVEAAVVVTDTFGRPWREGQIDFALGVSGLAPLDDLRGQRDRNGRELGVTVIATADQIAAAAGLLMGKADGLPAVLVRGLPARPPGAGAADGGRALLRAPANDLFR